MDWRQNKKVKVISSKFSVFDFLNICQKNEIDKLVSLTDGDGNLVFTNLECENIIRK